MRAQAVSYSLRAIYLCNRAKMFANSQLQQFKKMITSFALSNSKLKASLLLGAFLVTMGSLFIGMCEGAAIDSLNSMEQAENQTETTDDVASPGNGSTGNGTLDAEDTCAYNGTSPFGLMDIGIENADPQEVAMALAMMMAHAEAAVSELGTEAQEELAGVRNDLALNDTASSNGTDLWF